MIGKTCVSVTLLGLLVTSCGRGRMGSDSDMQDTTWVEDTLMTDSVAEVEEEMDEAVEENRVDGSFDDFIFTFTRLPHLQVQRTDMPLPYTKADGEEAMVNDRHAIGNFDFLKGDFYTVFYGSMRELEADRDETDSVVLVDRVDLTLQSMRTYTFRRNAGKWHLTHMADHPFAEDVLSDFYRFYAHFSTDSVFQAHALAPQLYVSIHDTEDELSVIDGTIDASQWTSFCPEVPSGVISNIRFGQHYTPQRIVMQKCGMGTGLQEVFTFSHDAGAWRLKSYED